MFPLAATGGLLEALAERDVALHAHSIAVGDLARALAPSLGLDPRLLGLAGEMHDVGKVAVPEGVLSKRGPLSPSEEAAMRLHTLIGEAMLSHLEEVAVLVRASHERWDGLGYPDGLIAEEIPLGARALAVCDAYSAMREDRPYGRVLGHEEAMAELGRCAGTQFDPDVVEAFRESVIG
jgi:HD-GYP domain-containing protein (c-di-GMP phosphodiesterase class II)